MRTFQTRPLARPQHRTSTDHRETTSSDPLHELVLLKISEYQSLRAEIQNRSDFQNRIFQIHFTALTLLLGAALTTDVTAWPLGLLPLTSSVFGMWWLDHDRVITTIGNFIKQQHEVFLTARLGLHREQQLQPSLKWWESRLRDEHSDEASTLQESGFMDVVSWSFVWPSVLVLVGNLCLLCLIICVDASGKDGWLDLTYELLPFPRNETGLPWLRAIMMIAFFIGGSWVLMRFLHGLGKTVYQSEDTRRSRLGMTNLIALSNRFVDAETKLRHLVQIRTNRG